ncbi:MAG: c-type cytochrome [Alphaproteobacteria bacterium]
MSLKTYAIGLTLILASSALSLEWVQASSHKSETGAGRDYWRGRPMHPRSWGMEPMGPMFRSRVLRQRTFMHSDIPQKYIRIRNPLPPTQATLRKGRGLYAGNCLSCHGGKGLGGGNAGKGLTPSPSILAFMVKQPTSVDAYLMWTIAEGGQRFGTDMPAFKAALKSDEIWSIITYMRAGFPK